VAEGDGHLPQQFQALHLQRQPPLPPRSEVEPDPRQKFPRVEGLDDVVGLHDPAVFYGEYSFHRRLREIFSILDAWASLSRMD
jgi:hypothetical protein